MPRVNLSCRAELVGAYCRTMNNYQSNGPHDCTASVVAIVVITVAANLRTLATLVQFTLIIIYLRILRIIRID